jgi:hypothetical protein
MAIKFKNIIPCKYIENVQTKQYTANAVTTVIDKCTICNVTLQNATVTFNIVSQGGTVANENIIIKEKTIPGNTTYLVPEMVGQILNDGDFISAVAGSVSTLVIRISGREIN